MRPFFPEGRPWKLMIEGVGLELSGAQLKQPHPLNRGLISLDQNGKIELNRDSFNTDLSGVVFATRVTELEQLSLTFSYANNGIPTTAVQVSLSLEALRETSARQVWFSRADSEPYLQALWLGRAIPNSAWKNGENGDTYLPLIVEKQVPGMVYYARITWLDGHVAWTRMIRR